MNIKDKIKKLTKYKLIKAVKNLIVFSFSVYNIKQ